MIGCLYDILDAQISVRLAWRRLSKDTKKGPTKDQVGNYDVSIAEFRQAKQTYYQRLANG